MTTVAIVQSCYIPWKGYFDLIRRADHFVLYDSVQYTARDWRNRNQIKTPHGLHWLTIPVLHESQKQLIGETQCMDDAWKAQHWETIRHHYAQAPCYEQYRERIESLYRSCSARGLSEVNLHFLQGLCAILGIATPLSLQKQSAGEGDKTDKLIATCKQHGATRYLSGPSAKDYLDVGKFGQAGIEVEWMDYSHYREYPQPYPPYAHAVSVIDLLFCVGERWKEYVNY